MFLGWLHGAIEISLRKQDKIWNILLLENIFILLKYLWLETLHCYPSG